MNYNPFEQFIEKHLDISKRPILPTELAQLIYAKDYDTDDSILHVRASIHAAGRRLPSHRDILRAKTAIAAADIVRPMLEYARDRGLFIDAVLLSSLVLQKARMQS